MRICILGAGSLGSVIGGRLATVGDRPLRGDNRRQRPPRGPPQPVDRGAERPGFRRPHDPSFGRVGDVEADETLGPVTEPDDRVAAEAGDHRPAAAVSRGDSPA